MSEIDELKSQVAELRNTVNSMTALLKNQNGMQIFPKTVMSALYNDDGTKYRLVKQISWAEYQALEQAGQVSATTIYDIKDRPFVAMASMIGFDDSVAKLGANNVQGAISVLDTKIEGITKFKVYSFPQGNSTKYYKFSGNWNKREIVAILLSAGQTAPVAPITISFSADSGGIVMSSYPGIVPVGSSYDNVAVNKHNDAWGTNNFIVLDPQITIEEVL